MLGVAAGFIVYCLWTYLHRAYYLSRLPGPVLTWPWGNLAIVGAFKNLPEALDYLSRKHGRIFRMWLGPTRPLVVIADPELLKEVGVGMMVLNHGKRAADSGWGGRHVRDQMCGVIRSSGSQMCDPTCTLLQVLVTQKASFHIQDRTELKRATGQSLLTTVDEKWRRQRVMLNPAFHWNALKDMVHVFNQHVPLMFHVLERARLSGTRLEMRRTTARLTMNIIALSAFDLHLGALDDDYEKKPLVAAFQDMIGSDQHTVRHNRCVGLLLSLWPRLKIHLPGYKKVEYGSWVEAMVAQFV